MPTAGADGDRDPVERSEGQARLGHHLADHSHQPLGMPAPQHLAGRGQAQHLAAAVMDGDRTGVERGIDGKQSHEITKPLTTEEVDRTKG